jgi:hypothetical protein
LFGNLVSVSAFTLGNDETALFHVGVVLDPLSDIARRWINLIQVGIQQMRERRAEGHLVVIRNRWGAHPCSLDSNGSRTGNVTGTTRKCDTAHRDQIPLKSFYRYHLLSEIKFGEDG